MVGGVITVFVLLVVTFSMANYGANGGRPLRGRIRELRRGTRGGRGRTGGTRGGTGTRGGRTTRSGTR